MFGYQGWFGCPGDGSPLNGWEHWFTSRGTASAATLRVDMWPDVSELDADERCATPLSLPDGQPAHVYSAYVSSPGPRSPETPRPSVIPLRALETIAAIR